MSGAVSLSRAGLQLARAERRRDVSSCPSWARLCRAATLLFAWWCPIWFVAGAEGQENPTGATPASTKVLYELLEAPQEWAQQDAYEAIRALPTIDEEALSEILVRQGEYVRYLSGVGDWTTYDIRMEESLSHRRAVSYVAKICAERRLLGMVPVLAKHMDVPGPGVNLFSHNSDNYRDGEHYPAVGALLVMGKPAIPAIIEELKTYGEPGSLSGTTGMEYYLLIKITGSNQGAIEVLRQVLSDNVEPDARGYIEGLLSSLLEVEALWASLRESPESGGTAQASVGAEPGVVALPPPSLASGEDNTATQPTAPLSPGSTNATTPTPIAGDSAPPATPDRPDGPRSRPPRTPAARGETLALFAAGTLLAALLVFIIWFARRSRGSGGRPGESPPAAT
ncbi:MAG: hypothetical protein HY719_02720 [Planctomycetes bacterium]|nr:hypothetical protein [Planctomycetota bacterium]